MGQDLERANKEFKKLEKDFKKACYYSFLNGFMRGVEYMEETTK